MTLTAPSHDAPPRDGTSTRRDPPPTGVCGRDHAPRSPRTRPRPRRVEDFDGPFVAIARIVCLGLVGVWLSRPSVRRRREALRRACAACRLRQRRQRIALFVVAGGLLALSALPLALRVSSTAESCGAPTTAPSSSPTWSELATAPSTGAGLLYAATDGAGVCTSPSGLTTAEMDKGFPRSGLTIGHVFITDPHSYDGGEPTSAMLRHEEQHSLQWAAGSVLGGPAALPLSYGATEILLPGERNPFEQAAGLTDGGYDHPDTMEPNPFGLTTYLIVTGVLLAARPRRPSVRHSGTCVAGDPREPRPVAAIPEPGRGNDRDRAARPAPRYDTARAPART